MLRLRRTQYTPNGTRGVLLLPSGRALYTMELPWKSNGKGTFRGGGSCIPEGRYPLTSDPYRNGGYESVLIGEVPGRSQIQIHIGNTAADVRGCAVVGLEKGSYAPEGFDRSLPAVLRSRDAYNDHFWPEVSELLPTEIVVGSGPKMTPAGMEIIGDEANLQEHLRQVTV